MSMTRSNRRNLGASHWLSTVVLFAAILAIFAGVGFLLGGATGVLVSLVAGGLLAALTPRPSTRALMSRHRATRLSPSQAPDLTYITETLSERAGLTRAPALYLVPSDGLNAFTVGGRDEAAIGVTRGLLRALDGRELSAVIAHEISHIQAEDVRVMELASVMRSMTRTMSTVGLLVLLISIPMIVFGEPTMPWGAALLLMLAPSASGALQMALSRRREFDADRGAAKITGDPRALASALNKLERLNTPWFIRVFGLQATQRTSWMHSHPSTPSRIRELLAMRPNPNLWLHPEHSWAPEPPTRRQTVRLPWPFFRVIRIDPRS